MSRKVMGPDLVSLRQAVLWIGLDLPPLERRLEIAEGYPRSVAEVAALDGLDEGQRAAIEAAKAQLLRALIEDRLRARGRPQIHDGGEVYTSRDGRPMVIDLEAPDRPLTEIPPTWWEPDAIDWDHGHAYSIAWPELGDVVAYIDVGLRAEDVRRLRRLRPQPGAGRNEPARPGPKPIYDVGGSSTSWQAASSRTKAGQRPRRS